MGLVDKLKEFLNGSEKNQVVRESPWEKRDLARDVMGLIDEIKRIDSFDRTVWNMGYMSEYTLADSKTTDELKRMKNSLNKRLLELQKQKENVNLRGSSEYEKALWTGEKPKGWTDRDLDLAQTRDDR